MRFLNLFTGFQFLISFFLVWNGCSFSRHPAFALRNVVVYLSFFVFIFGCLEAWGEYVVLIRWNVDSKLLTKNRIAITRYNLYLYRKDCGSFPSQEQGLDAMMKNPGIVGWKGPYLDDNEIVDSWGNQLRFKINDNGAVVVWSIGPDGTDGTDDDIRSSEFLDD